MTCVSVFGRSRKKYQLIVSGAWYRGCQARVIGEGRATPARRLRGKTSSQRRRPLRRSVPHGERVLRDVDLSLVLQVVHAGRL